MRFESLREGFAVSFGGRPVLSHSSSSPCLHAGEEAPLRWIESGGGRWARRAFLGARPLRNFHLLEAGPERVVVNFEGRVGLEIEAGPEALTLRFREAGELPFLRLHLLGVPGESIFGGGAGAGEGLDLAGSRVEVWGGEGGGRGGLFAPSPRARNWPQASFLSSRDYWVRIEAEGWCAADFRSRGRLVFDFSAPPATVTLASSKTAAGALGRLGRESGASASLPAWTRSGALLSVPGGASEAASRLAALEAAGASIAGLRLAGADLLDPGAGDRGVDATAALNAKGLRMLAEASPALSVGTGRWEEARDRGFLLEAVREGSRAPVDLGSPEAAAWIGGEVLHMMSHKALAGLRLGRGPAIRGGSRAGGEGGAGLSGGLPVSTAGAVAAIAAAECLRPRLWSRLVREALGPGDFLLSSASGWSGSGGWQAAAFPAHDGAGRLSTGLAAVLSHGLSGAGVAWMDASLGGARSAAERSLLLAGLHAIEIAAFGPILEIDGGSQLLEGARGRGVVARMTRVFRELEPYHEQVAAEYRDAYLPPLRPAILHYEAEGEPPGPVNRLMYGRDLLVAAPLDGAKGDLVGLDLPSDDWIHLWSSRRFRGGPVRVEAPPGQPAVFWRADSSFAALFDSIRRVARKGGGP